MLAPSAFAADTAGKIVNDGAPFGVCSHPFAPREVNIREELFDKMQQAGVQWLRTDFVWGYIYRGNGKYDFKLYDEIVEQLSKRNIKVLAILTGGWRNKRYDVDTQDWIDYIRATVKHFKGRVSHWEIINEHDHDIRRSKDKGAQYGKALAAACKAIRQEDPNAVILYGGLSSTFPKYIDDSLKECPTANFDIMNFHCYPAPNPPENIIKQRVDILKESMKKSGQMKPIWLTEIGATTPPKYSGFNVIKRAAEKLGLPGKKIACIKENLSNAYDMAKSLFPESQKIRKVNYSNISKLTPDYVLVLPSGQAFPQKYSHDIANFILSGGAVIHSGGFPFFYDMDDADGRSMGNTTLNMFGANLLPHWQIDPNMPARVTLSKTKSKIFESADVSDITALRCFDYNTKLLPPNSAMIPLIQIEVDGKTLTPAAAYVIGANKGVFISVACHEGTYLSEEAQAMMLARNYLYALGTGIEKVFNYNFRSHEEVSNYEGHFGIVRKDLSEKPSFYAFKNLVKLIGKNTKIVYQDCGAYCRADWVSPEGKNVCALWCKDESKKVYVKANGNFDILNLRGKTIGKIRAAAGTKIRCRISQSVRYFVGAKIDSVTLIKKPEPSNSADK